MLPLVTCIMPTANRFEFLSRAVTLFLAQDYPRKQLVIVEDGQDDCSVLCACHCGEVGCRVAQQIKYARLDGTRRTIGEKRNIACGLADGDLVAHWDDDDWHAPNRLSVQIEALFRARARLCGADRLVFYDAGRGRAYLYQTARVPWLAGGTLLYEKTLQREQPFQHVSRGEDTAFIDEAHRRGVRFAAISDPSLYVATIHDGNTSPKRPVEQRWGGFNVETVRRWIGETGKERAA